MRMGITYRLLLSILAATCLSLLAMFFITQWSINKGFLEYIRDLDQDKLSRLAATLGEEYDRHKSWDFLRNTHEHIERLPGGATHRLFAEFEKGGHRPPPPLPPSHQRADYPPPFPIIVLDLDHKPVLGTAPDMNKVNLAQIMHDNKTVGYVGLIAPPRQFLNPRQVQFLARQKTALVFGASGMVLIVMLFSLPLSRRLVRPIRAMAAATRDVAAGKYGVRIPASSSDELGQLAQSFNLMALTLEKNEKTRRQWVADISHELRTPVAILQGEIEALLDGVRSTTPEAISSLHGEVLRLRRLVEDLYQLALSDLGALTYKKQNLDLANLLSERVEAFYHRFAEKRIALTFTNEIGPLIVFGDTERLHQLFTNLFDNSLNYTDTGGKLMISAQNDNRFITISFDDSAPAVPEAVINRLFDRLYRCEGSRSRASGGAGLGLSICKNIVEAHAGRICAKNSALGGLSVTVSLPHASEWP